MNSGLSDRNVDQENPGLSRDDLEAVQVHGSSLGRDRLTHVVSRTDEAAYSLRTIRCN